MNYINTRIVPHLNLKHGRGNTNLSGSSCDLNTFDLQTRHAGGNHSGTAARNKAGRLRDRTKMYKKAFVVLTTCGFISLLAFMGILYSKNVNFLTVKYNETNLPGQQFRKSLDRNLNVTEEKTLLNDSTDSTSTVLTDCPDTSPKLLGPLHVDFNFKISLDDLRKQFNGTLRSGGHYKPPDCISKHKVAVIIPFRNRYEHLNYWLYYLHPILARQQLDYRVYVINQDGDGVFNRAKLMNAGFIEALKIHDYECFVFSDVDLVPMDDRNIYRCFDNPRHLAVAMDKFNFGLPYNGYYGGVSALSKNQFMKINGFSNTFWGWGGEDDDIYKRIIFRGMSISRPDMVTGKYRMIRHNRDLHNEPNPHNPDKLQHTKEAMDKDGLNTLKYTVKKIEMDVVYTFITVDIEAPQS